MSRMLSIFMIIVFAGLYSSAPAKAVYQDRSPGQSGLTHSQVLLIEEIRHQLVTLPYYNVFDWLEGSVTADGKVELRGQVVDPTTKSGAEKRVKKIESVEQVVDNIEVLPLSPNDQRIRREVYRAIFNYNSPLFRYA